MTARGTRGACGAALVCAGAAVGADAAGVRINWTDSIPRGFYRTSAEAVARGSLVLACVPRAAAEFGRTRGYLVGGDCAGGVAPVGKPVAAVAGDTVDVSAAGVRVNGRLLPNSVPLTRDAGGRGLPAAHPRRAVVAAGELWLVSSWNPRSYDARYWGPVPRRAVRAVIRPWWVERASPETQRPDL